MSRKAHTVAFVRNDPRSSERSQREAAKNAGVTKIYTDFDLLIRQRRDGLDDIVAVKSLFVLANPADKRKRGGLRQSLWAAIDAIEAAGCSILELDTGLSSKRKADRDKMIRAAEDVLAHSRSHSERIGRPPRVRSESDLAIMRLHWNSNLHSRNSDAIAAMKADGLRVSVSVVTKVLGPSGRVPGVKREKSKRRVTPLLVSAISEFIRVAEITFGNQRGKKPRK
jgi:hypothetical protein